MAPPIPAALDVGHVYSDSTYTVHTHTDTPVMQWVLSFTLVCSSCVEWAHVVVGWYFILCLSRTHASYIRAHVHMHTEVSCLSLSTSPRSFIKHAAPVTSFFFSFPRKPLSPFPVVLGVLTALTSLTPWHRKTVKWGREGENKGQGDCFLVCFFSAHHKMCFHSVSLHLLI